MKGKFIVFEGIDNCGKSTQAKLADDYLIDLGQTVVRSREPGGTKGGEAIRSILKDKTNMISPIAEVQLFNIARKFYKNERVLPVINSGGIFIGDRYYWSTEAYQGARGIDLSVIKEWNTWATEGLEANLVILIDRDAEEAILSKPENQRDRFEQSVDYMKKVRENYLRIADENPLFKIVQYQDGNLEGMFSEVKGYLDELIQ